MDRLIAESNEWTAVDLLRLLLEITSVECKILLIMRVRRKKLGWVKTRECYCQLIRVENAKARVQYATRCLKDNEQFMYVIFHR